MMAASPFPQRFRPRLLEGLVAVAAVLFIGGLTVAPAQAAVAPPEYEVSDTAFVEEGIAGVAVDPDRNIVYVAGRSDGLVYVYDGGTLAQLRTIPVPNEPSNLAVGPSGVVYVSQYTDDGTAGTVSVILPDGTSPTATLPVGNSPAGVTVSPDGTRLYVANGFSSFISVFDISTPDSPVALSPIITPGDTETITVSADGQRLYVADNNSSVYLIDAGTGTVTTWDTGTSSSPHQVVLTADGSRAIVTAQSPSTPLILNATTGAIETRLLLDFTNYASEDPGLNSIFVTAPSSNTVGILDRTTGELVQNLAGVSTAYYIATNPVTHAAYVSSFDGILSKITPVQNIALTDPADQIVSDGASATFTAALTGAVVDDVAWEVRADPTDDWAPAPGAASTTTYVIDAATLAESGSQYRAVFTAAGQTWATAAATLTVTPVAPFVLTNPADQRILEGAQATFASSAGGSTPLQTQWERSSDNGQTWAPIANATDTTYTATFTHSDHGARFRAVFTNDAGRATTAAAQLNVDVPPVTGGEGTPGGNTTPPRNGTLAVTGGTSAPLTWALGGLLLLTGTAITLAHRLRHRPRP
jgi:WD40 repeat protein